MRDWSKGKSWRGIAVGWWIPVPIILAAGGFEGVMFNFIIGIPLLLWAFWPTEDLEDG